MCEARHVRPGGAVFAQVSSLRRIFPRAALGTAPASLSTAFERFASGEKQLVVSQFYFGKKQPAHFLGDVCRVKEGRSGRSSPIWNPLRIYAR